MKSKKRSSYKFITKEAKILRHLRQSAKITMREAGRLCQVSDTYVSHIEHGRMDLSQTRIEQFVSAYGFSYEADFMALMKSKNVPQCPRDIAIDIVNNLDDGHLKALIPIMENFRNLGK